MQVRNWDFNNLQSLPRKRMNSVVKRKCCCFYSENYKDKLKYNRRGQCCLKLMLALQLLLYLTNVAILLYDYIEDVEETYFAFHSKIDFFYVIVTFWLFCGSLYFLWHSTNRSIIVDLKTYGVLSITLNLFIMWRAVDMLFISKNIEPPGNIQDSTIKAFDITFTTITYMAFVFSILFSVLTLSILPAVYEDIKDNIFLALGGNTNIWENFYNVTFTKSVVKLDLIFNCQFWTAFFFVVWDFQGEQTLYKVIYWVVYGFSLYLSIQADWFGFYAVKKVKKGSFLLFFIFRIISEATKIFIVEQFWRKQTFLFQDLDEVDKDFFEKGDGKRLRVYVTVDCAITVLMFIWCVYQMYKCYQTRNLTAPEYIRQKNNVEHYF